MILGSHWISSPIIPSPSIPYVIVNACDYKYPNVSSSSNKPYNQNAPVMTLSLRNIVDDFAEALSAVDKLGLQNKNYLAGIGPFGEVAAVKEALKYLKVKYPSHYQTAVTKRCPDVLIPNEWALEFKIARPFGNDAKLAEHWSENILHPYEGNVSSLGDCLKLIRSGLKERKAVIVFAYEHTPPQIDMDVVFRSFEMITKEILGVSLGDRHTAEFTGLIHPMHRQGKVIGWEVLGAR
jgi:hypothetical protein